MKDATGRFQLEEYSAVEGKELQQEQRWRLSSCVGHGHMNREGGEALRDLLLATFPVAQVEPEVRRHVLTDERCVAGDPHPDPDVPEHDGSCRRCSRCQQWVRWSGSLTSTTEDDPCPGPAAPEPQAQHPPADELELDDDEVRRALEHYAGPEVAEEPIHAAARAYLRMREQQHSEPFTWQRVALRVGEEFAHAIEGVRGYYDLTPAQWQDWMLSRVYEQQQPAPAPGPHRFAIKYRLGDWKGEPECRICGLFDSQHPPDPEPPAPTSKLDPKKVVMAVNLLRLYPSTIGHESTALVVGAVDEWYADRKREAASAPSIAQVVEACGASNLARPYLTFVLEPDGWQAKSGGYQSAAADTPEAALRALYDDAVQRLRDQRDQADEKLRKLGGGA